MRQNAGDPSDPITSAVRSRVLTELPALMTTASHSRTAWRAAASNAARASGTMP